MLSFLLDGNVIQLSPQQADLTVLDYLREQKKLSGSKEGCASGDCGACTVVLAELTSDPQSHSPSLHYRAVNSCITFMSALHGKQLITVEQLANGKTLHPVQQSLVNHHGSQCGFCTPGFIMSMFALYHQHHHQDNTPDRETVNHALSGNLCRCTGYRPIIDATISACSQRQPDQFDLHMSDTIKQLSSINPPGLAESKLMMPDSRESLLQCIQQHPDAPLFAGSTDLALQVTQQLKQFEHLIALSQVKELNHLSVGSKRIVIGAALPLSDIEGPLLKHFPDLTELFTRFASYPVRNQATLGGNVANASPIGDMPPVLLALNATLLLDNGQARREIPIKDFFIDYRKTALQQGEWIEAIAIPRLKTTEQLRAYKVSKRMEDDISAVCAVFCLELVDSQVVCLRCGFGGVAAIPSLLDLSSELAGRVWSDSSTFEAGKAVIENAFRPIDDVRASKEYRQQMCINLWRRFWLETRSQQHLIATRVIQPASSAKESSHA